MRVHATLLVSCTVFVCLLFCNITMTGEPTHTTSKERMAPELMFLSKRVPQVSITDLK